jgi:hypothetical protein
VSFREVSTYTELYTNNILSKAGYYYNRLKRLKPDGFRPKRPSSVKNATPLVQQENAPS